MTRSMQLLLGTLAMAAVATGCLADPVEEPKHEGELVTSEQMIRPTDGDGWQGNGYGAVEVFSYDTPSRHFRVWYTNEGVHQVPQADVDPADGVPDYVALVGKNADATWAAIIDTHGFNAPLSDELYHDRPDYGGDGRFDIYLQNIDSNDGYRVVEACTNIPHQCAGYLVMENDFTGFSYESRDIATKVLTSHEFGHAILDAYQAELPEFVTEGFATWFEELTFPEQDDFDGFVGVFFRNIERPLDSQIGGLSDIFPYATAIWPQFIQERFGLHVVRAMLTGMVNTTNTTPDWWTVTDEVLAGQGSSLEEAFIEFATWNLFTSVRAGQLNAGGYANAADYAGATVDRVTLGVPDAAGVVADFDVAVERLSADYIYVPSGSYGGQELEVEAFGRARFVVMTESEGTVKALYELRPAGAFDRTTLVAPPGGQIYVVAVNPAPERVVYDGRIVFSVDTAEPTDVVEEVGEDVAPSSDVITGGDTDMVEPTPEGGEDCACATTRQPGELPGGLVLLLGLVGVAVLRRRG